MKERAPDDQPTGFGAATWFAIVVAAGVSALVIWRTFIAPAPPPAPTAPSASAPASADARLAQAPKPARCTEIAGDALVIGEPPKPKAKDADASADDEDDDDELGPFAPDVGRGTVYDKGFAVGVLKMSEKGTLAMVATLGTDGRDGKLVKLGVVRGDLDPPIVAAAGSSLLAAIEQPNAGGIAIKIAKVTGEDVTWGIELPQGRSESPAMDLAASGDRGVVVWDDTDKSGRSEIRMASFDVETLRSVTKPKAVSGAKIEAEAPKVVPRPGGYWLAYLAKKAEEAEPKKKPKEADDDTEPAGDDAEARWIEVVPLDANGAPAGPAKQLTPKEGHALGFDLQTNEDGGLLVAYRDDDQPSGAGGGRLLARAVTMGGMDESRILADEGVGSALPDLLSGWLAIASLTNKTRLGRISPKGELIGAFDVEAAIGGSEAIAASKDVLLLAQPAGHAMKLRLVRCADGETNKGP